MDSAHKHFPFPHHRPDAKDPQNRWRHLKSERRMQWLNRLFGGANKMLALREGTKAPDFSLPALDGGKFSLQDALQKGQVLAVFFKVSCPVCQYAFPFFER